MKRIKRMISYPVRMFDRLSALSGKTGLAVTELVRRAIDEYLDKEEAK